MQVSAVVMLSAGLALGGLNLWLRWGRTPGARAWAGSVQGELMERAVLVVHPLLATVLLLGAVTVSAQGSTPVGGAAALLLLLALITLLAFLVLPLPVPRAVQPAWYRDRRAVRPRTRKGRSRA